MPSNLQGALIHPFLQSGFCTSKSRWGAIGLAVSFPWESAKICCICCIPCGGRACDPGQSPPLRTAALRAPGTENQSRATPSHAEPRRAALGVAEPLPGESTVRRRAHTYQADWETGRLDWDGECQNAKAKATECEGCVDFSWPDLYPTSLSVEFGCAVLAGAVSAVLVWDLRIAILCVYICPSYMQGFGFVLFEVL